MFENKTFKGIHYSRFIASFNDYSNARQNIILFRQWLESLRFDDNESMPEEIVQDILYMADNGKLELEMNAKEFLKNQDQNHTN